MSHDTPMTCEQALRLLATFLDDELHRDEYRSIQQHLAICRSCFSRADFERRLKAEIGSLRREEVSPAFEQRVRRLIGAFTDEHEV